MGYKTIKVKGGFNVIRTTDTSTLKELEAMPEIFSAREIQDLAKGTVIDFVEHRDDAFSVIEQDEENMRCLRNEMY